MAFRPERWLSQKKCNCFLAWSWCKSSGQVGYLLLKGHSPPLGPIGFGYPGQQEEPRKPRLSGPTDYSSLSVCARSLGWEEKNQRVYNKSANINQATSENDPKNWRTLCGQDAGTLRPHTVGAFCSTLVCRLLCAVTACRLQMQCAFKLVQRV